VSVDNPPSSLDTSASRGGSVSSVTISGPCSSLASVDGGASVVEVVDSVVLDAVGLVVDVLRGGLVVDVGRGWVVVVLAVVVVVVGCSVVVVVVASVVVLEPSWANATLVNAPRATAPTKTTRTTARGRSLVVSTPFTRP
jgi:hypothetical protein